MGWVCYTCTGCRVVRKELCNKLWFEQPCIGSAGPEEEPELGQPCGPAQEITCSNARAKEEKRKRAREEKEKDQEDRGTVKRARKQSMCYEELEVMNERNGHEVLGKIQAHPTHVELVLCGGYIGCVRCGRMTSTNSGCNKLKEACRNHIPKGSEGPVRRLCQGKYPQPQEKSRHLWPNGEEEPIPKRVNRQ